MLNSFLINLLMFMYHVKDTELLNQKKKRLQTLYLQHIKFLSFTKRSDAVLLHVTTTIILQTMYKRYELACGRIQGQLKIVVLIHASAHSETQPCDELVQYTQGKLHCVLPSREMKMHV